MPRQAKRKPEVTVDARPRAVRYSAREKEAARQSATGDPRLEIPARRDASALASAADFLRRSEGANRGGAEDSQRNRNEQQRIEEWARAQGCLIDEREFNSLTLISNSTSEHEVWFRESDQRAVKRTWPGFFGQVPVWKNGRLDREPATPAQYLERQRLQNETFDGDIVLEGVCVSSKPSMIIGETSGQPAFVISQPFIKAMNRELATPTESQIAAFFAAHDFEPVPGSYFGWQRAADGVVILDARRDNFIWSAEGVIPIDLQMAVIPEIIRAKPARKRPSKARSRDA
jgi:hypothetical protein